MAMTRRGLTFACMFLVAALAACGDTSFSFGQHPDVTWWTDHETGNLSDWTGSVAPGGFILPGNSRVEVVKGIARSGDYALLIQDDSPNNRDYPLAARNGPLPTEVYCSAWYYMPEPIRPKTYWWFLLFRSRHAPYDAGSFRDEVNLSFTTRPDGSVGTRLSSPDLGESVTPLVDLPVPVGQWFHIEVFHRTGTDDSGVVDVWQDGVETFHAPGKNSETDYAEWMVGGVVDALTTSASQLYIDDAAISKRRLGPLPPFSRE
jgi:hypothetical protein